MIKNERQYRITKAQLDRFVHSQEQTQRKPGQSALDPVIYKAHRDAISSQIADLQQDIMEYEQLRQRQFDPEELRRVVEIPRTLIRARIALGISQKDLARRLGLKEQQIQRYEATEYASASLARITEIASALGFDREVQSLPETKSISLDALVAKLRRLGLTKEFIRNRILPHRSLPAPGNEELNRKERSVTSVVASRLERIFGWSFSDLASRAETRVDLALAGVRFKLAEGANRERLSAYMVYAHYLALLVLEACSDCPRREIVTNPMELRTEVEAAYGDISLESVLSYVWDAGIPVIGIDDPGAFHGACFRVSGRNVIVLKQKTKSSSRWTFDLLHEFWHAAQEPKEVDRAIIESDEMSPERRANKEEQTASQFAGAVLLKGNAQDLAEMCIEEAGRDIRRLKGALRTVASRQRVPVDALANYLAFRLSLDGHNWWGTATNLQGDDGKPWVVIRDKLLSHLELTRLADFDREILLQALRPWSEVKDE